MFHRLPLLVQFVAICLITTGVATAQRVQFPSAAPAFNPTNPPPVVPSFDPYGNPLLGTPPADIPYNVTPQFVQPSAPGIQPSPQFGQQVAPPLGQQVFPPPNQIGSPGVPQSGGSLFPSGLPFQWESGAYQYQNSDGRFARLQRFLQQISLEHTWIYGEDGSDDLSINRTELAATFGIPIFYNPDTPLLITPGFAFNWLDGPFSPDEIAPAPPPENPDLPARVFDAYLDAAWHPRLTDWLHADLGVRTGVWTDFEELNGDSLRILGRGLGVLAFSPQFDVIAGVWYLDRNDIKLLPAGGVHWRPNGLWDFYVVFPNPKIRRRSINIGTSQWWMYAAGEYGGGRWTIERQNGAADDIDINDVRVIFGLEWETQTQARGHVEIGYVFDREILFTETSTINLDLDDSFLVRAGVDF